MAAAGAMPLIHNLPEEILIWEILVRLDPISLLRCRAVRRAWRCATSTRHFFLAHHARQPTLPVFYRDRSINSLAFDYGAAADAQLHTVARRAVLEASCDGLLVQSSNRSCSRTRRFSVCNPTTREHASLRCPPWNFNIVGMYPHRPTGEYRLLLRRWDQLDSSKDEIGCYVLPLGSDQPPRYIGWLDMVKPLLFERPALIRDRLHWLLVKHRKHVLVFDIMAESFRHMRALVVLGGGDPDLFEMDDTLGIHSLNADTGIINIWVLQDYESEVWDFKYRIKLPVAEIREQFVDNRKSWDLKVVSRDGYVLLLVNFGGWLLHVDSDGKLIDCFDCGHRDLWLCKYQLKQSLVQHTFFPALKSYAVGAPPLI